MFGQQQQPTSSSSSTPMAGIIPPPNLALLSQLFGQQQQSPIGTPSNTTSANNTAAANTGTNSSTGGTNTGSVGGGDELSMEERLAQRFRVQLGILESMGFVERTANIQGMYYYTYIYTYYMPLYYIYALNICMCIVRLWQIHTFLQQKTCKNCIIMHTT